MTKALIHFFQRFPSLRPYALVSLAVAILGIFFFFPLLIMLLYSFAQRDTYGGIRVIQDWGQYLRSAEWISNYVRSFEPIYVEIYFRSLWMAILTTALCLLIGYPISYFIALRVKPSWKNTLLTLVIIPFWTSFLIRTYAWIIILRSEGLINQFLMSIGLIQSPIETLLYSEFAVMLGLVYGELPFMILPLYASIEKLDVSLLEAANDLGANSFWTFFKVTVPLTMPGIAAGIILVFIPTIGTFITPDLLGGAKSILVGNLIQNQFAIARDKPFGSAICFGLTAFVLIVLLLYARHTTRREKAIFV
ncbi:ABC transporter permease [bacterium]|nr:ABC transporter permease [bacterium]